MPKKPQDSKRVAMSLVVDDYDNVLMGNRNDGKGWTTPGGHVEKGEDPLIGMIREFKEETGVDPKGLKLAKVCWKKERGIILYIYKIDMPEDYKIDCSKDPDKECDDWVFIDPNDVKEDLAVELKHNEVLKYWANS